MARNNWLYMDPLFSLIVQVARNRSGNRNASFNAATLVWWLRDSFEYSAWASFSSSAIRLSRSFFRRVVSRFSSLSWADRIVGFLKLLLVLEEDLAGPGQGLQLFRSRRGLAIHAVPESL